MKKWILALMFCCVLTSNSEAFVIQSSGEQVITVNPTGYNSLSFDFSFWFEPTSEPAETQHFDAMLIWADIPAPSDNSYRMRQDGYVAPWYPGSGPILVYGGAHPDAQATHGNFIVDGWSPSMMRPLSVNAGGTYRTFVDISSLTLPIDLHFIALDRNADYISNLSVNDSMSLSTELAPIYWYNDGPYWDFNTRTVELGADGNPISILTTVEPVTPPFNGNNTVPEPSSMLLLGMSLLGSGLFARRRKR